MEESTNPQAPVLAAPAPAEQSLQPSASVSDHATPERPRLSDEEIDQLVAFSNQAYERLQAIEPYAPVIDRYAKDEEYRNFVQQASEHYERSRQELAKTEQEKVPEWAREIKDFVAEQKQMQKQMHEHDLNRFYTEQRAVGERLMREHNLTPAQVTKLASYADGLASTQRRRVGLEEAYNEIRGFGSPASGSPPTVGLRGDASTPGIPSGSRINVDDFKKDFHSSTLALLKKGAT
jgi:hypothetical protein